jgi:glycosyltransferase involved in cell wall biosynthesis
MPHPAFGHLLPAYPRFEIAQGQGANQTRALREGRRWEKKGMGGSRSEMKPLRILQVQTYLRSERINPRAGGKSRIALMLSKYLLEAGHEVAIYPWPERIWGKPVEFSASPVAPARVFPTMALPALIHLTPDAIRLLTARIPDGNPHPLFQDLCFLEGLRLAIGRFQPDLLHCQQTESDIPILLPRAAKNLPSLLTHHSGRSSRMLNGYDRIIFLSRTMQAEVGARSGYPVDKSRVLYSPISDPFLTGEIIPAHDRRGLISIGNLKDAKGIDLLLEAYRRSGFLREHPLHLCGSGPDEERYKLFAAENNLPVVFHGRLSVPEIKTELSKARLLVNPSRMEGFSVALCEALACGTPVIGWASQVNELEARWGRRVGHPFDGRGQSAEELETLIQRVLKDSLMEDQSRGELSRLARESFSMESYGQEMIVLYEELLSGGSRP